jgi:hypothetical protein
MLEKATVLDGPIPWCGQREGKTRTDHDKQGLGPGSNALLRDERLVPLVQVSIHYRVTAESNQQTRAYWKDQMRNHSCYIIYNMFVHDLLVLTCHGLQTSQSKET